MYTGYETAISKYTHFMVEHMPVGVALFEAQELRLLFANKQYQVFLGSRWGQGQAIGHPLADIVPRAKLAHLRAIFHKVIEKGVVYRVEADAYGSADSHLTYWNWTLEPISEEGRVSYLLLTATEVTSEVLARKALEQERIALMQAYREKERERQRLAYIETILLSMRGVVEPQMFAQMVLRAIDTCFAPQVLAFYGVQAEKQGTHLLLASHIQNSFQQKEKLFPFLLAHCREGSPLAEVMRQRTPLIKEAVQHSEGGGGANTEREQDVLMVPAMQWVLYLPLWRERYEGMLLVAFARRAEVPDLLLSTLVECAPHLVETLVGARHYASVVDEERRLYTTLDQLPEGVVVVESLTSTVKYANPAAANLLGVVLPQLLGRPLKQLGVHSLNGEVSQKSAVPWSFALIHALWGRVVTNQELIVVRPDGSDLVVLASAAPIRTPEERISGAVMVFQDITALKRLEQQKNEFFAVANHELRTPLTVIMGFIEILQARLAEEVNEMDRYAITSIVRESEHLNRLLGELLDVSRLEQARLDLKRDYQDLVAPLEALVTKHRQATGTHHLHFTVKDLGPAERLMGEFDILRAEQILRNLVSNAMKYSPAGSDIEVGLCPQRDPHGRVQEVLIWVKDQGMGIDARDLPYIFERFYRAKAMDASISGFGIGLYLTKELVQAHGGRIWVESTPGKGSTFFVVLPLRDVSSPQQ
jgi:PAS domain S-box-containing protein